MAGSADAGGRDGGPRPIDAGVCAADDDCDDGVFCDGVERCAPGAAGADTRGCAEGDPPCGADRSCDEAAARCRCPDADLDGDGHDAISCGGDDCDDGDATRYPGNIELCDADDHDEDCDGETFGYRDEDGDGWPDRACCNGARCGGDCDDGDASRSPTETEVCDGRDDDCDGAVDEGVARTWYVDADADGHGDASAGAATLVACTRPDGWAAFADDCDDTRRAVHPGAIEICEGSTDEDCDGVIDPPARCACRAGDSLPCLLPGRCAAGTTTCIDGVVSACSIAPVEETCNGDDDDCDGATDETALTRCFSDGDGDGWAPLGAPESARCGACGEGATSRVPTSDAFDCDDADASRPGEVPCP